MNHIDQLGVAAVSVIAVSAASVRLFKILSCAIRQYLPRQVTSFQKCLGKTVEMFDWSIERRKKSRKSEKVSGSRLISLIEVDLLSKKEEERKAREETKVEGEERNEE